MIFLDTNILIDLFADDGAKRIWSETVYTRATRSGSIVSNLIVLAELAAGFDAATDVVRDVENLSIEIVELQIDAVMLSAGAFREYRRRGGSRERILPDFLIAAHAAVLGATLVTRDRRLASYFPDLTLLTPETHPYG